MVDTTATATDPQAAALAAQQAAALTAAQQLSFTSTATATDPQAAALAAQQAAALTAAQQLSFSSGTAGVTTTVPSLLPSLAGGGAQVITTTPTVVPPRVGGIGGDGTPFTGGSTLKPRTSAETMKASRPIAFRDAIKIEEMCSKGLPAGQHLHLDAGAKGKCTLTAHIAAVQAHLVEIGCDHVFFIYDARTNTEINLFEHYPSIPKATVKAWVSSLRETGVLYPDPSTLGSFVHYPVCEYDKMALKYSGNVIKASIGDALWTRVEREVGQSPDGPVLFHECMLTLQHNSASTSRKLVTDLQELKLVDEPGEDVLAFLPKVEDLAKRISACQNLCGDLDSLVIKTFMGTSSLAFNMRVLGHYNQAETGAGIGWERFLTEVKDAYTKDTGLGMWAGAAKTKAEAAAQQEEGTLKALTAAMNVLQQTVKTGFTPSKAPGSNADRATRNRHRDMGFRKIPPKDGEPLIKIVDGITYTWCLKCGWWTFGEGMHNGDTHRSKSEVAAAKAAAGAGAIPPASTPAATSSGGAHLAASGSVRFADDTTGRALVTASSNDFPRRNRLQMIQGGGLYTASAAGMPALPDDLYCLPVPAPVAPLVVCDIGESDFVYIGTCDVCGEEGPDGQVCGNCDDPACVYAVIHCGTCVLCGDFGPTGTPCTDCDPATEGVYADSQYPTTPFIGDLIEQLPGALVEGAGFDDVDDDDASFVSALSHVSDMSDMRSRLAGGHLNFSAGQDSL
jgi:hypothetical protein